MESYGVAGCGVCGTRDTILAQATGWVRMMARVTGGANKPDAGFEDMPLDVRAVDGDEFFSMAHERMEQGDGSAFDALMGFTTMQVHERATVEDYRLLDLEAHRRSVGLVVDVALSHAGESLREARKRSDYTQEEAARLSGINVATLRRIERGKRVPTLNEVVVLSWLYNVHLERVLGMMSADEERLLETYRATEESVKADVLTLAKMVQSGKGNIGDKIDANVSAFRDKLRKHADDVTRLCDLASQQGITRIIDIPRVDFDGIDWDCIDWETVDKPREDQG